MSDTPSASNDGSKDGSVKKPYARVITDKRREQNRRSQKAYRERLKKRLENLEELEDKVIKGREPSLTTPVSKPDSSDEERQSQAHLDQAAPSIATPAWPGTEPSLEFQPCDEVSNYSLQEAQVTAAAMNYSFFEPQIQKANAESSPQIAPPDLLCSPEPDYSSVIDLGDAFDDCGDLALPADCTFPNMNIAIRPWTPAHANPPPDSPPPLGSTSMWHIWPSPARVPGTTYIPPPEATLASSINSWQHIASTPSVFKSSTSTSPSASTSTSASPEKWPGFSLTANYLRLQGENSFAASLSIATSIGITQESYIEDHPSPFYLSNACFESNFTFSGTPFGTVPNHPSPPSALALARWSFLKPSVRPTPTQLSTPHPSYLDCIIFPSFRSRAIELSAKGTLDHFELFMDLIHDGLVCWGNATPAGMGSGVAWSMRSWEARPWFLKKWWFLAGDEHEEVWEGSRWWWRMRGEDIAEEDNGDLLFGTNVS